MSNNAKSVKERLERELLAKYSNLLVKEINQKDIIFEDRVKLKCLQCKHYGIKPTCPPFDHDINLQKIIKEEYSNILIFVIKKEINDNFDDIRMESTNELHKILLQAEKFLYQQNNPLATSFIGGSCKLCKEGCNKERCNNPQLARIPMEALGINVIETMKTVGIDVIFPIGDSLSRYGMLVW